MIEPESVQPGVFEDFIKRLSGPESEYFANRIRAAYVELRQRQGGDDISSAEFDVMCFGEALPQRRLDLRVARSIVQIGKFSGEPVTAASCATEAGLSPSRFLHLFKEETESRSVIPPGNARGICFTANQDINPARSRAGHRLSRSDAFQPLPIRCCFYGLMPRAIFFRLALTSRSIAAAVLRR